MSDQDEPELQPDPEEGPPVVDMPSPHAWRGPAIGPKAGRLQRAAAAGVAVTISAAALGALAIGAVAIGTLALGRLVIGKARIRTLQIDHLIVKRIEPEA